jgi:hypothetical protein
MLTSLDEDKVFGYHFTGRITQLLIRNPEVS